MMLVFILAATVVRWAAVAGAENFFYEVQGSVAGITEDVATIASVQKKINSDITSTLHRSDITVRVDELKSNFGIQSSGTVFHAYVTTSIADRETFITTLKKVPTVAAVFVAARESLPAEPDVELKLLQPQVAAADLCLHDSITLPNNTCICQPYTSGIKCENINCQNFGMLNQDRCFCAPGYYSKYCENRGFRPAVESDVSLQSRSLVIVFSLSTSMEQQFLDFRANLPDMVAGMGSVLDDISSYVFVGYVSTSTNTNTYYVTGGSQLSDLDQMFDSLVFYTPSVSQPFLGVLIMALQMYPNTKAFSNVLLFADTGASDAGDRTDFMSRNTYEHTLISMTAIWRNKLTFIISNPQQQRISTNSFDVYRRLAQTTHGDLLLINKNDTAKVMTEVLSHYDKTENLAVRYRFNCSDFPMLIIPTENFALGATKVLLTVDSNDATKSAFLPPSLGDLNGVAFEATSEGAFYSFYTMPAGTAYVRVDSQNTNLVCSMRVFVTSSSTLLLSYIDNPSMDIGYPFPYNGVPQTASGLPIGVSKTALVALQSVDSTAGSALQGVSIGSKRALDSTYTLTFAVSQECTPGPFSQSAEFYDGDKRATRVLPAYCSSLDVAAASTANQAVRSISNAVESQCAVTNVDVLADPRQSRFRQIIFAVENSEALSAVAQNLVASVMTAIDLLEADGSGGYNNQYSLILYDDKEVRAVSSTPIADDFSQQFTASMNALAKNEVKIATSLSLDAIHKGYDISIFYPTILHLFTSTAPGATAADSKPLPRDFQVNVYTLGDGTTLPANADLGSHQRQTSGRNIPITVNGTAKLSPILHSSVYEKSLVLDDASEVTGACEISYLNAEKLSGPSIRISLKRGQVDLTTEVVFMDKNTITISIDPSAFALLAFPWSMTVKTTAGPCYAQVRVVSPIVVIPGFSSNATTDFPADFPFTSRGSDNRTYAAFRVSSDDVTVEKASFGSSDPAQPWNDVRTLSWVQANLRDASCSYQFITSIFQMTSSSTVRIEVSGHTQSNFYFQRTFFFSQTAKTATSCSGGRLNQFGECVCPAGYTGEFCDEPVCSNGGTRSTSICVCSTGFYGQLCNSQVLPSVITSTSPANVIVSTSTERGSASAIFCHSFLVFTLIVSTYL